MRSVSLAHSALMTPLFIVLLCCAAHSCAGCIDELRELLDLVSVRRDDCIISVGDLVGKGPDSKAVVQLCRSVGGIPWAYVNVCMCGGATSAGVCVRVCVCSSAC